MAVESSNTVGYVENNNLVANQFYMIGVNFETVGAGGEIHLNDLLKGNFPQIVQGDYWSDALDDYDPAWMADSATVQVLEGVTYKYYYYITDAWYNDGTESGSTKAAWADIFGCVAGENPEDGDGMVAPGEAVWFKSPSACSIKTMGQVIATATDAVTVPASQFSMVANPFPEAFNLNDAKVAYSGLTQLTQGEYWSDALDDYDPDWMVDSDMVQVLNGVTYKYYYYITDAWYNDGTESGSTKGAWADIFGCVAGENPEDGDGNVALGGGFWIKPHSAVTVTFTK